MSIDLNSAEHQSQGTSKPIPPKSKVWVSLGITYPTAATASQSDPTLTRSRKGQLCYLNTVLTVSTGEFAGKKIFHNFNVANASTDGERKACQISMAQIRAAVEVARGVKPSDAGPQATQARIIESWRDLDGIRFPIEVKCVDSNPTKDGRVYINNELTRVVTMEDPDYKILYEKGEIISDEPIPVPGQGTGKAAAKPQQTQQQDEWGANQQSYSAPANNPNQLAPTQKANAGVPPWAQKQAPPPQQNPVETDQVPY